MRLFIYLSLFALCYRYGVGLDACDRTRKVLTQLWGTISDGGTRTNYSTDSHCEWLIKANSSEQFITLKFQSLVTECSYDYIYVYDGDSFASPMLGSFSGKTRPQNVVATSGFMLILLYSDTNYVLDGFEAEYSITECRSNCSGHGVCAAHRCICEREWGGLDCSQPMCPDSCSRDIGGGHCEKGKCICNPGFSGLTCSLNLNDTAGNKLDDGFALFGGRLEKGVASNELWFYNATANRWSLRAVTSNVRPPPLARHTLTEAKGWLYVMGGSKPDGVFSSDLYRIKLVPGGGDAEQWEIVHTREGKPLDLRLVGHSTVYSAIYDSLIVYGGLKAKDSRTPKLTDSMYMYSLSTMSWARINYPKSQHLDQFTPLARAFHTSTLIGNYLVVFGGYAHEHKKDEICYDNKIYLYHLGCHVWVSQETLGQSGSGRFYPKKQGVFSHAAAVRNRNTLILVGGYHGNVNADLLAYVFPQTIAGKEGDSHESESMCSRHHGLSECTLDPECGWCSADETCYGRTLGVNCTTNLQTTRCPGICPTLWHCHSCLLHSPAASLNHAQSVAYKLDLYKCNWCVQNARCHHVNDNFGTCGTREDAISHMAGWWGEKGVEITNADDCIALDKRPGLTFTKYLPPANYSQPDFVFTFEYLEPYEGLEPCISHSNCLACLSDSKCGWCSMLSKCYERTVNQSEVCRGDSHWEFLKLEPSTCENCSNFVTCDSCIGSGICEWRAGADFAKCHRINRFSTAIRKVSECPMPCHLRDNCSQCLDGFGGCVWCHSSQECFSFLVYTSQYQFGMCREWSDQKSVPEPNSLPKACKSCSMHPNCSTCLQHLGCGWCYDVDNPIVGVCAPGDFSQPNVEDSCSVEVNRAHHTSLYEDEAAWSYAQCPDVDECGLGLHDCHTDAKCTNTHGSYNCQCKRGFIGDGKTSCKKTCYNKCVHGTCSNEPDYVCHCDLGWTGLDCSTNCGCNNHSTCSRGVNICDECLNWTSGEFCQFCKPGSFGNATSLEGCKRCNCNDHGDKDFGICDSATGVCVCQDNTEGPSCDKCKKGFYGDPRRGGTCYYQCMARGMMSSLKPQGLGSRLAEMSVWELRQGPPPTRECLWIVSPTHLNQSQTSGGIIQLEIDRDIDVGCTENSVYVYDGLPKFVSSSGNRPSHVLGVFCTQDTQYPVTVQAKSGVMTVHYKAEGDSKGGFNATVFVLSCPDNCPNERVCLKGSCVCPEGTTGHDCQDILCPNNCSAHLNQGHCDKDYGRCVCATGWGGANCSSPLDPDHQVVFAELFNSAHLSDQYEHLRKMLPRFGHSLLADRRSSLWLFGGYSLSHGPLNDIRLFDTINNTWVQVTIDSTNDANMPRGRYFHAAAISLSRREIFVHGGLTETAAGTGDQAFGGGEHPIRQNSTLNDFWKFSLKNSHWIAIETPFSPPGLAGHTLTLRRDEESETLILIGGFSTVQGFLSSVWEFDPVTDQWAELETAGYGPIGVYGHSTVYHEPTQSFYVFGGYVYGVNRTHISSRLFAFHYPSRTWSALPTFAENNPPRLNVGGEGDWHECRWSTRLGECISPSYQSIVCAGGVCGLVLSRGALCPQPCNTFTQCSECLAHAQCGWCALQSSNSTGQGVCSEGSLDQPSEGPEEATCDALYAAKTSATATTDIVVTSSANFSWHYVTCPPENECANNHHNCDATSEMCVDTQIGYDCICGPGYKLAEPLREGDCIPVCTQGCVRGRCTAPDTCTCDFGYVGANCSIQCQCNGHSHCAGPDKLDECLECHNNTQGPTCNRCLPLFVGEPTDNGECIPCSEYCNNHTDICVNETITDFHFIYEATREELASILGEGPTTKARCIGCKSNTTGAKCEDCLKGHFRGSEDHRVPCRPCVCHGHGHTCNTVTGEGCDCHNNTESDPKLCIEKGNCWEHQCTKCKESYSGMPTEGHQCYKHMSYDLRFNLGGRQTDEADPRPIQVPLNPGQGAFFAVHPRFVNVDIRITVDVTRGNLDLYLAPREDAFVVELNRSVWTHEVKLDPRYYDNGDHIGEIYREEPFSSSHTSYHHNSKTVRIDRKIEKIAQGLSTYTTVYRHSHLLVVKNVTNRLVITLPNDRHDFSQAKFFIILLAVDKHSYGAIYFRQDQLHIDLFVFFSVFFSCFFLFLAACVVAWKAKQAADMRRARRRHVVEMLHMAKRPFATVSVLVDHQSACDIQVRPVALEPTYDGLAAVGTLIVRLPGGKAVPTRLAMASALVLMGRSNSHGRAFLRRRSDYS
ncbi:unnamed protein product [Nesidiocoris tenuis]|uniref:Multiple epidermal growth factor-like domains protein 8 n=1 Tax=Nesidiocoris tenuis TaxID=355587 RepID=A0A6H5G1J6_9HEMI|nr:unnamed protein product [Nesidiocoris tenuis]